MQCVEGLQDLLALIRFDLAALLLDVDPRITWPGGLEDMMAPSDPRWVEEPREDRHQAVEPHIRSLGFDLFDEPCELFTADVAQWTSNKSEPS